MSSAWPGRSPAGRQSGKQAGARFMHSAHPRAPCVPGTGETADKGRDGLCHREASALQRQRKTDEGQRQTTLFLMVPESYVGPRGPWPPSTLPFFGLECQTRFSGTAVRLGLAWAGAQELGEWAGETSKEARAQGSVPEGWLRAPGTPVPHDPDPQVPLPGSPGERPTKALQGGSGS